jgi:hypothetical protein
VVHQVLESHPRVDDILHQDNIAARYRYVQVLGYPYPRCGSGIVGDGHEVESDGQGDLAHEIRHEAHHPTLDPNQDGLPIFVVLGNLLSELRDALVYLPGREQHPVNAPGARLGEGTEAVLGKDAVEIAAVQQLDVDLGVDLAHPPDLPILLRDQALLHRSQLDL